MGQHRTSYQFDILLLYPLIYHYKKRIHFDATGDEVFRYLKGETIPLKPELIVDEGTKSGGWYLVCVENFPLGWGKVAGLTLKNKYHQGWRLL